MTGRNGWFPMPLAKELNALARARGWDVQCDTTLEFQHPSLTAMRELWRSKSIGRLPARSEFSMRELKTFLPSITVLDIVAAPGGGRRYLHRYVGMQIVAHFGEMTGRHIDEVLPPALLPKTLTYFDAIAMRGQPLRIVTNFEFSPVNHLQSEMFVMPLADDGVTPDKLMSLSYFATRPGT